MSKRPGRILTVQTSRRAESLLGHFGVSLGSVLLSVGDFASLDGHFAIIMESLWVYERPIQKKHSFTQQILVIL